MKKLRIELQDGFWAQSNINNIFEKLKMRIKEKK